MTRVPTPKAVAVSGDAATWLASDAHVTWCEWGVNHWYKHSWRGFSDKHRHNQVGICLMNGNNSELFVHHGGDTHTKWTLNYKHCCVTVLWHLRMTSSVDHLRDYIDKWALFTRSVGGPARSIFHLLSRHMCKTMVSVTKAKDQLMYLNQHIIRMFCLQHTFKMM